MKFALLSILISAAALSAHAETVKEFSNGCTRTCTGNWSYNAATGLFNCDGKAGPLQCTGEMGHNPILQNRSADGDTQTTGPTVSFNADGSLHVAPWKGNGPATTGNGQVSGVDRTKFASAPDRSAAELQCPEGQAASSAPAARGVKPKGWSCSNFRQAGSPDTPEHRVVEKATSCLKDAEEADLSWALDRLIEALRSEAGA